MPALLKRKKFLFIKIKKTYFFVFLAFVLTLFFSFSSFSQEGNILTRLVSQIVINWHLKPQALNDATSNRIFELYIKQLDPRKEFFTQKDILQLSEFRFKQDNLIQAESLSFVEYSHHLLLQRLNETKKN